MKDNTVIKDALYGAEVWVLAPADIAAVEDLLRELAPKFVSDECNNWRGCTWELKEEHGARNDRTFIVALKSWDPSKPDDVGVLVHEMLHVTAALLRDVGMTLNEGSEEAYTYLHEWLVVEAMKGLS